jgi:regulatory protein YycI of two-component signal transduction system YycFG
MEHLKEKLIFADLAQIEKVLTEDASGVRARQIIDYFEQCIALNTDLKDSALEDSDRQLESKLNEGMRASKRVIQQVWETLHSKVLAH